MRWGGGERGVILAWARAPAAAPGVLFLGGARRSGAGLIPADKGPGGAAV